MYQVANPRELLRLRKRLRGIRVARNVVLLGLVSLFTDVSSEMVATILPLYLVYTLGFTPLQFGIVDGLQQGAAAVMRIAGGFAADRTRRHKEVAELEYGISALFPARAAGSAKRRSPGSDRLRRPHRKGIRTAPRDALISDRGAGEPARGRGPGLGRGLCLIPQRGSVLPAVNARIFGADFRPVRAARLDGIRSRARVSPQGRYGAATTFVVGHSYLDKGFSTLTALIDMDSGEVLTNLEKFDVTRDGEPFKAIDFNFWGVTFTRDERHQARGGARRDTQRRRPGRMARRRPDPLRLDPGRVGRSCRRQRSAQHLHPERSLACGRPQLRRPTRLVCERL